MKIYWQIICHFLRMKELFPTCVLQWSLIVAYKKLEQENHHFYQKNRIFWNFGLWRGRKTLIFLKTCLCFFEYLPLGNFKSLLLINGPTFHFFTPAYYCPGKLYMQCHAVDMRNITSYNWISLSCEENISGKSSKASIEHAWEWIQSALRENIVLV